MIDNILEQYDRECHLYISFTNKLKALIEEILEANGLRIHSVTHRVKSRDSLQRKLLSQETKYSDLHDITDTAGLRITTYYEDDVDTIGRLINLEFAIDEPNSIDKRTQLDPDRFGYLSLHHVISLPTKRCELAEYRRFLGLKAEIQTRSILQHAWAEIEHDLGYKSRQEVPRSTRRKFSRLAGLLELADQEFISIREELDSYEKEVPKTIEQTPQLVTIDKASLIAFTYNNKTVTKLDNSIVSIFNCTLEKDDSIIPDIIPRLEYFGVETIAELESLLVQYSDFVVSFAQNRFSSGIRHKRLKAGISLGFLTYALSARGNNIQAIEDHLNEFRIVFSTLKIQEAVRLIAEVYKNSVREGSPDIH